ncbi:MAG: hypothetical protein A3D16_21955 [Rhodobacterales bacterium RIFCSPHIGHO2_02_FULL_62_130]|nr:MAG: hypothetical protein A3D16_21955 [Rhodobacterales bacterium RIFCSPHIGHO2_02_FULL_62_130]OHC57428.1 MAG: hypothetical protein A3E48_17415 [Rhodobacterales bacterium RIFCSPHIGHO2_12_FULL_62_75]
MRGAFGSAQGAARWRWLWGKKTGSQPRPAVAFGLLAVRRTQEFRRVWLLGRHGQRSLGCRQQASPREIRAAGLNL